MGDGNEYGLECPYCETELNPAISYGRGGKGCDGLYCPTDECPGDCWTWEEFEYTDRAEPYAIRDDAIRDP